MEILRDDDYATRTDNARYCLVCSALNAVQTLGAGEGFRYIPLHASDELAVRSLVVYLNGQLKTIRCSVCAQQDETQVMTYWLSFRFFEVDRYAIIAVLSAMASAIPSYRGCIERCVKELSITVNN